MQPPKVRELEGKVKDTEAITVKVGSNLSDQFGMKPARFNLECGRGRQIRKQNCQVARGI